MLVIGRLGYQKIVKKSVFKDETVVLQYNTKRCVVYGAIVFTWIFMPAYFTTMGSIGTDIVKGTCVPWGVYGSYAAEVAVMSSIVLLTYLLPLMTMMFSYIRIVYELKYKVGDAVVEVGVSVSMSFCIF